MESIPDFAFVTNVITTSTSLPNTKTPWKFCAYLKKIIDTLIFYAFTSLFTCRWTGIGHPASVLPPTNIAIYPLLLLIVAPLGKSLSANKILVRGQPPESFDVPSVETSLLSRFRIMLDCDLK